MLCSGEGGHILYIRYIITKRQLKAEKQWSLSGNFAVVLVRLRTDGKTRFSEKWMHF